MNERVSHALSDEHRAHLRKIGIARALKKVDIPASDYKRHYANWKRSMPEASHDELHTRVLAHAAWQQHAAKHRTRQAAMVSWERYAIMALLALIAILLCSAKGHAQFSHVNSIQFQQGGTNVSGGFFAAPFSINCATNLTCTASGSTLSISASSTASASWSSLTAGTNANTGTFASTAGTYDFSGVSIFKFKVGTGSTLTANGTSGQVLESNADGTFTPADPIVSGPDAPGVAPTRPPVQVGLFDGTNVQRVLGSAAGRLSVDVNSLPALPAGTNVIGHTINDTGSTTVVTGNVTVVQGTGSNLHVDVDAALPAGSAVIGALTANQSVNVAQVGGSAVATGTGVSGAGIPRVTVSSDSQVRPIDSAGADLTAAKGTQTSRAIGTQDLKDSGRSRVTFTADKVTPAASDTLVTFTKDVAGTATASQTTYTVTSAKTFRLQALHIGAADSTTTALSVRVAFRENTGGACTASSAPAIMLYTATPAAVAAEGSSGADFSIPDGLEFPAADSLCISAIGSTATGTLTVSAVGYEY